ncbi:hypothetical protein SAMN04488569_104110 [Marinilactibacillus piezotolerans]|uniref:Uncharacterized protein n=1 Tax=Marinilactibacillus piezotolerans TaxID=258723 RepID=A0A1I3ZYW6_9LACT|nr:hypothetical protein SAMN04488569_104110 [Marinilactibacillus piezotolerans]
MDYSKIATMKKLVEDPYSGFISTLEHYVP